MGFYNPSAQGVATSVVVGTTVITGGTTGRILYDNGGVLGEYTLTGSGTVVAMQTSPTLITPALGVATATSLAIGGATIGSNALAVTGSMILSSTFTMGSAAVASDSGARGPSFAGGDSGGNYGAVNTAGVGIASTSVLGWTNSTISAIAAKDTGISKISAGLLGIGTGAQGSTAGSLSMTNLTLSGTLQLGNAYAAGVVAATGTVDIKDSTGTVYHVLVHN